MLPEGDLLRDVYLRGSPAVPTVALTFDDGPNGRCTEAVLDVLRELGAPATFFVLGENVALGKDDGLLARMVREGHTIGVHSTTHGVRPLFLHGLTAEELAGARAAVEASLARAGVVAAPPLRFYRPPFGFLTEAEAAAAAEAGFDIVEWTISVRDWEAGRRPEDVADAILARVRPGDVIVLHDGDRTYHRSLERCTDRGNVVPALRLLLPALAARGLRPAPLEDVLGFVGR
jgi:peptidoglycan/xylan/chitin deacetylase (PgdA/CDA1 family)